MQYWQQCTTKQQTAPEITSRSCRPCLVRVADTETLHVMTGSPLTVRKRTTSVTLRCPSLTAPLRECFQAVTNASYSSILFLNYNIVASTISTISLPRLFEGDSGLSGNEGCSLDSTVTEAVYTSLITFDTCAYVGWVVVLRIYFWKNFFYHCCYFNPYISGMETSRSRTRMSLLQQVRFLKEYLFL